MAGGTDTNSSSVTKANQSMLEGHDLADERQEEHQTEQRHPGKQTSSKAGRTLASRAA